MANQSKGSWLGSMAAALMMATTLMNTGDARADCGPPPFELLWTYPADGDVDVPVNAQFWVLSTTWGSGATYTLSGASLSGTSHAYGSQVIDPGPLEADTDYVLELRFNGVAETITIDFRTQTAEAAAANAPQTLGHTTAMQYSSHACADVISAQDCFDTGQDTLLTVQTEDDDQALGWVIKLEGREVGAVWPARCGDPSLYGHGDTLLHDCVLVSKIGPGGLLSEATQYCPAGHAMGDAAVPDPQGDASVPIDHEDAGGGVVSPLDAGMQGTGGTEEMPSKPRADGTGGVGGGDAPRENTPEGAAQDDGGCSVTSHLGRSGHDAASLACLGVLALALRTRRRARPR